MVNLAVRVNKNAFLASMGAGKAPLYRAVTKSEHFAAVLKKRESIANPPDLIPVCVIVDGYFT
jgi:hypothetical protein